MKRELTLQEIQYEMFNVLQKLAILFEELNLTYFLAYGTLLGAVRHQGFIPWDDDVDLWVPREDYEKFIMYFEHNVKELLPLKLTVRKNTKNYIYAIARVIDTRFEFENEIKQAKMFEGGIFVDIYPLDNYGNDLKEGIRLSKYFNNLNRNYYIYVNKFSTGNCFKKVGIVIWHYFLHLIYGKNYSLHIEKKCYEYLKNHTKKEDYYIGVPIWDFRMPPVQYRKEWFRKKIKLNFMGKEFYVPVDYDKILKLMYGEYMELPPAEQRHPTHKYKIYRREDEK